MAPLPMSFAALERSIKSYQQHSGSGDGGALTFDVRIRWLCVLNWEDQDLCVLSVRVVYVLGVCLSTAPSPYRHRTFYDPSIGAPRGGGAPAALRPAAAHALRRRLHGRYALGSLYTIHTYIHTPPALVLRSPTS